jgi:type II secretory pathway pseudopilin PulG
MNMPTLAQQARWLPRIRRWLVTSSVVAGLGLLGAQVLPRFARLTEARADQSAVAQQLAMADAALTLLRPAAQQGTLPTTNVAQTNLTSDPNTWVQRITDMSGGNRLRAVTVQAGVPEQSGDLWRLPLILNFEGDYLDACTFLQDAERLPGVVRISKLHLHCTNLPTGQVEVQVAMDAYLPENP